MANPIKHTSQAIDNWSFDEGLGVKITELIGENGVLINPATEETLQAVLSATGGSTYTYIQSAATVTYKYYGYYSSTGWQIKRKTLASGVWEKASGLGDYDTAWADRANKSYSY
jgi:hypothetical protein